MSHIGNLTIQESKDFVSGLPSYLKVTGSYFRNANANDLDVLSVDKHLSTALIFFDKRYEIKIDSLGSMFTKFKIKICGKWTYINIWYTNKDNLFINKLLHDYPQGYIIGLRKALKKQGYKLGDKLIRLSDNKEIKLKSYKDAFKLAGIQYRTPQEAEKRH